MKNSSLESLPKSCEKLIEAVYAIITYEKLSNDNFYYSFMDFEHNWVIYFINSSNQSINLIIPKNVNHMKPPYLLLSKSYINEKIEVNLFVNKLKELGIIVSGHDNVRTKLIHCVFVKQESFYDFYLLCKKNKIQP